MDARIVLLIAASVALARANQNTNGYKVILRIFQKCDNDNDLVKCLKVQALRIADRALNSKAFGIAEGIDVIRDDSGARSLPDRLWFTEENLKNLTSNQINRLLTDTTEKFFSTHKLQVNVSKIFEGRGRKDKKNSYMYPMLAAVALIKGGLMTTAYKGIMAVAGAAIIIGKIALVMGAMLALRNLIKGNEEKTTFEIVKYPKYVHKHTYSSSYDDSAEGHYHRSLTSAEKKMMDEKAYESRYPRR